MQGVYFRQSKLIQSLLIAIFILMSASCSLLKDTSPELKADLGLAENVRMQITASTDINPNEAGIASPVRIVIYQLVHVERFNSVDFFALNEGTNSQLNNEIRKYYDTIMLPGEEKTLSINIQKEIKALGIVAEHRDINTATWKRIFILPERPREKWYRKFWPRTFFYRERIAVNIGQLAISIKKMD